MARLSTKTRDKLPAKDFALPGKAKSGKTGKAAGRFPIEDRDHAEQAERLVGRAQKAGSISPAQAAEVKDKAAKKLGEARNGRDTAKLGDAKASDAKKWSGGDKATMNVGGLEHHTSMKPYQHEKVGHTSKDR